MIGRYVLLDDKILCLQFFFNQTLLSLHLKESATKFLGRCMKKCGKMSGMC